MNFRRNDPFNQISGNEEENIDAAETAENRRRFEMERDHRKHRNGPQPVYILTIGALQNCCFDLPLSRFNSGSGADRKFAPRAILEQFGSMPLESRRGHVPEGMFDPARTGVGDATGWRCHRPSIGGARDPLVSLELFVSSQLLPFRQPTPNYMAG